MELVLQHALSFTLCTPNFEPDTRYVLCAAPRARSGAEDVAWPFGAALRRRVKRGPLSFRIRQALRALRCDRDANEADAGMRVFLKTLLICTQPMGRTCAAQLFCVVILRGMQYGG